MSDIPERGLTGTNHPVIMARKTGGAIARSPAWIGGGARAPKASTTTTAREPDGALLGQIEVHSIDWIPDPERHGKVWQQTMLWFLGNFQYFTIPIGFVGPSLGLSLGWSILA